MIRSESTSALGQPRLTKPTFGAGPAPGARRLSRGRRGGVFERPVGRAGAAEERRAMTESRGRPWGWKKGGYAKAPRDISLTGLIGRNRRKRFRRTAASLPAAKGGAR